MEKKHPYPLKGDCFVENFHVLGQLNREITNILMRKVKKKGKFTAQPQYPCFGQDLGDSAGAGNLPTQK